MAKPELHKQDPVNKKIRKTRFGFYKNMELSLMASPMLLYFLIFHYLPMGGIIMAFKNFRYDLGIFGSKWAGLRNFEYFFKSQDAWLVTRNTLGYGFLFIILNIVFGVTVALILYEVGSRTFTKYFQTTILLPYFMSWVVVAYIFYAFLDPVYGVLGVALKKFGIENFNVYTEVKYWPFILSIAQVWKSVGMGSVMYYAALMGIDTSLYEACKIDGGNKMNQIWYISIPELKSLIIILTMLAIGNIFRGDFGLFYQIPMDVGALYPATDIIDTYIYRGLRTGDVGVTAAVGLVQSVVGFVMVMATNYMVRIISPENSIF